MLLLSPKEPSIAVARTRASSRLVAFLTSFFPVRPFWVNEVSIQRIHQLRSWQSCIHLQERQRHLVLRWEEGLSSSLHSQTLRLFFYLTERYRHLSKRQEWLDPSKFRCLEALFVSLIKIKLCKCNLLLNVRYISYLLLWVIFAHFLRNSLFQGVWRNSYRIDN